MLLIVRKRGYMRTYCLEDQNCVVDSKTFQPGLVFLLVQKQQINNIDYLFRGIDFFMFRSRFADRPLLKVYII